MKNWKAPVIALGGGFAIALLTAPYIGTTWAVVLAAAWGAMIGIMDEI